MDVNLRKVRYNYIEHCTFLTYFVQTDNIKYVVKFNLNGPLKSRFNELFFVKKFYESPLSGFKNAPSGL